MRAQPHVNALDVEPVAALRHDADLVAAGVLRQADGALRRELPGRGGVVGELGEGLEDLLLEAPELNGPAETAFTD
ncbi:hypothetical protein RJ640_027778 [Escallonia rubra]|uniref:Uncharacterized protein n=1 Tax=Escallonia rubra TaxID=112253 RepID=A0AA88R8F5_9ASTE|nr:hypothetical protein RJ640_027778 [Escallonia rubra]